jgi:hypothetical protein
LREAQALFFIVFMFECFCENAERKRSNGISEVYRGGNDDEEQTKTMGKGLSVMLTVLMLLTLMPTKATPSL